MEKQIIEVEYSKETKELIKTAIKKIYSEETTLTKKEQRALLDYIDILENVVDGLLDAIKAEIIDL